MVENSGRCNKNEHDEKVNSITLFLEGISTLAFIFLRWFSGFQILPTGTPWIPSLVQTITDVAINGKRSILIDQKLIEGPNANDRGKLYIPLILAIQVSFYLTLCVFFHGPHLSYRRSDVLVFARQYFFVIKPIQKFIKNDIARETKASWA